MTRLPHFDPPAEIDLARPFWEAIDRQELYLPRLLRVWPVAVVPGRGGPRLRGCRAGVGGRRPDR